MAVTRTLFRAIAHSEPTVAAVVSRMNAELARDNEQQFFVTALVGRLDLASGELTFVNAGHLPPLRSSASGTFGVVDSGEAGVALGILEDAVYGEGHATLATGDVLLLFTDGVTEAINRSGELFSDARLHEQFARNASRPAAEIVDRLVADVNRFAAGAPQEDDITLLALRYRGH